MQGHLLAVNSTCLPIAFSVCCRHCSGGSSMIPMLQSAALQRASHSVSGVILSVVLHRVRQPCYATFLSLRNGSILYNCISTSKPLSGCVETSTGCSIGIVYCAPCDPLNMHNNWKLVLVALLGTICLIGASSDVPTAGGGRLVLVH
jgi:hypothetical protein